ncbi:hypothetical protein Dda_3664 [Drechslerella dactyloides]|uniref:Uncharacterized protein n=1 Tax=Drechslerella dactyloides TaxID=74499 RepID=A0AAD6IYB8_DREDA|nr:hypothetical protein Dda_3664 [Drechslerella dactyloides]
MKEAQPIGHYTGVGCLIWVIVPDIQALDGIHVHCQNRKKCDAEGRRCTSLHIATSKIAVVKVFPDAAVASAADVTLLAATVLFVMLFGGLPAIR